MCNGTGTSLRALVWGFDTQLGEIQKRKELEIVFRIGKREDSDLTRKQLTDLSFPVNTPDAAGMELYSIVRKENLAEFIFLYAREDKFSLRAISDYPDIFYLFFCYFYHLLKSLEIEIFLLSCIPHIGSDYLALRIAKKMGVKILTLHQSVLPGKFFCFNNLDFFGDFGEYSIPSEKQEEDIKFKRPELPYMRKIKSYRFSFLQLLWNIIKYQTVSVIWRYGRFREYRRTLKSLERKIVDYTQPYVYFPMQLDPELTTSVLGGNFSNQIDAIERLSALIPDGWKIYVKENPKQTEFQRGPWFFERLKRIENLILVPCTENSCTLIDNSRFVATITGTAGWEAILGGKKVLVFGLAWYRKLPGVIEYRNGLSFKDVDEYAFCSQDLQKKANILFRKLPNGVVDPIYKSLVKNYDADRNAEMIATFIAENI